MKNLITILALSAVSFEVSAANYVFTGAVSGELTDVANWSSVTSAPSIWSSPFAYAYGNYSAANTLPTSSDIVGIGGYNFKNQDNTDNIKNPPTSLNISTSYSVGNVEYRITTAASSTVWLGSAGHAEEDFTFKTGNFLSGSWGGRSVKFLKAADASQKTYSLSFQEFTICNDSYVFGSVETGVIDKISATNFYLWWDNVKLTTFAKSIEVSGNLKVNRDSTKAGNSWKIIVPNATLSADNALISVTGTFSKVSTQLIDLDFTNATLDSNSTYLLISAGATSGFDNVNAANDFNITGLTDGSYSLKWDNNSLTLTTVPEASTIASILGFVALSVAFMRRRLRK